MVNKNGQKNRFEKIIIETAKKFSNLSLLDKKIEDLTNSEKQEVQIMISLLHKPKILLLDNCFTMMNKTTKNKILKVLQNYIKEDKLTIILTSTNLEDTLMSNYTYVLNKGNIIMEGSPISVLREESILNRAGLELPFMIDLSLKLEFYELLETEIIDMDRMIDTLWK